MRSNILIVLAITAIACIQWCAYECAIDLGTAGNFAVLAGASVTNTAAPTVIEGGNVGAISSITGFPPGTVSPPYTTILGGSVVTTALNDLNTAYGVASGLSPTQDLTGTDLGGLTLMPGVYKFDSSAQLTGTLTLDDGGNANAQFVFQIGSTLTTASNSAVTFSGDSVPDSDVFWQVGSSATLGTDTAFEGDILAEASITLTTRTTIEDGSALAYSGSVTLDDNTIIAGSVPEPSAMTLALIGGVVLGVPVVWKRLHKGRLRDKCVSQGGVPT
jgi:hypothetical protein